MMKEDEIDDHEAANLEMIFQHVTDKQLIRELVRRKRAWVVKATQLFYRELVCDDRYMEGLEYDLRRSLVRELHREGHIQYYDRAGPMPSQGVREATIVVLREKAYDGN